jgi:hypothetical protein
MTPSLAFFATGVFVLIFIPNNPARAITQCSKIH